MKLQDTNEKGFLSLPALSDKLITAYPPEYKPLSCDEYFTCIKAGLDQYNDNKYTTLEQLCLELGYDYNSL